TTGFYVGLRRARSQSTLLFCCSRERVSIACRQDVTAIRFAALLEAVRFHSRRQRLANAAIAASRVSRLAIRRQDRKAATQHPRSTAKPRRIGAIDGGYRLGWSGRAPRGLLVPVQMPT